MTVMTDEANLDARSGAAGEAKRRIIDLMRGFSVETTPGSAAKVADFREHLAAGTTVYVTFLPGSDFADTVAVCKRLAAEGMNPVPHVAARSIPDKAALEDGLRRLADSIALRQVLVIAGSVTTPVGAFADSMQLLETGLFDKYGVTTIGVAGHPEGSPDIPDAAIEDALAWKNAFAERTGAALYVVTQFCFEAAPVIAWDKRLRAGGNRLPIHIGVPGLATLKTLLGHAKACGIGPSMRFLTRQARNVAKLMTVSAPDRLVTELAAYRAADPACGIAGVHVYPLGGLRRSALWSNAVADGQFTMKRDGTGFTVDVDLD
ncbi:MAG TPA: methylenetetrahydrofolate reductase [Kiloniellales bacterium]